jgi:hypothetical protein
MRRITSVCIILVALMNVFAAQGQVANPAPSNTTQPKKTKGKQTPGTTQNPWCAQSAEPVVSGHKLRTEPGQYSDQ